MGQYTSPILEQLRMTARERPLNDTEMDTLRRTAMAEWILAHRNPLKAPPAEMIGREPWIDLVGRYCLA